MQCYNRDTVQIEQNQILMAIYEDLDNVPLRNELNRKYDETVVQLETLFEFEHGVTPPCWEVDADAWSMFSDLYKDHNGVRPTKGYTRKEVNDWLNKKRIRDFGSLDALITD